MSYPPFSQNLLHYNMKGGSYLHENLSDVFLPRVYPQPACLMPSLSDHGLQDIRNNAVITPDAVMQGSFFRGAHAVEEQIWLQRGCIILFDFIAFEIRNVDSLIQVDFMSIMTFQVALNACSASNITLLKGAKNCA